MNDTPLEMDNAFWRFSLAVYAAPGVADECLTLQEQAGIDVNVLLFCLWLGAAKRIAVTDADLGAIVAVATPWQREAVQPLRSVRQHLKVMPERAHPEVQELRRQVAAAELAAEQVEQALLFARAPPAGRSDANSPEAVARANVAALLRSTGGVEPAAACVERLMAAAAQAVQA